MSNNPGCPKDLEDAFVNVMFQEERNGETVNKGNDSFYDKFVEKGERSSVVFDLFVLITRISASGQYADPAIQGYV